MADDSGRPSSCVDYFANHRDAVDALAQWHHQEWSHLDPDTTLEQRRARLLENAAIGSVPTGFVALVKREAVSSAMLVSCDLETHPELRPWLASVYVREDHRGAGIGTLLVERVASEARILGETRLYLFTPDRQSLYRRLGWTELFREEVHGEVETVMVREL